MRIIKKGATSQSIYFSVLDSASTTGGKKTGIVYNAAGLTAYYTLNAGSATAITLATLAAANSAFSSGGFKEVDATNAPGLYRLDVPNAALTGADSVVISIKGASGMVQVDIEIQLSGIDIMDAVRGGMTAMPNANAEAAGGLYTRGSGAGQINQPANGMIDSNMVRLLGTAVSTPATAGIMDVNTIKVTNTAQTARDLGASVLLSAGTGTGQLDFTSGVVKANLAQILGTALTETAGLIAAGFKQFFNIASPTSTMNTITAVTTATNLTTNNDKTGYGLSAAAVQAVWDALTSALTTVGSVGKRIADFLTGDAYARLGAPAGASVSADVAAVKTDSAAVKAQTDKLAFTVANQIDANVLDWKSATAPAMTGDAFARLGAPAGASVSADVAAAKVDTAAIKVKTDFLPSAAAGAAGGVFIAGTNAATTVNLTGSLSGSVGSVTAGVTVTTNNDKTGYGLSSTAITAIWAYVIEGTHTAVGYMRLFASALLAKLSGAATSTIVIRDIDDTKNRISVTVDADGNRSAFGTRDET